MPSGRTSFSHNEIEKIRRLLREKGTADRDRQKAIRAMLRPIGFRISDFTASPGFVESDLDDLIARDTITVVDEEEGALEPTTPPPLRTEEVQAERREGGAYRR